MKKTILLILLIGATHLGFSQGCPTNNLPAAYYLDEIEDFVNTYPDCRRLPGNLSLSNAGDISQYPGLSQIDTIGGLISCNECYINSLVGWENLKYVESHVWIDEPSGNLTSFAGWDSLNYVGGSFRITEGGALETTNGLNSLSYVGNKIEFYECRKLTEIVGLENITQVNGSLVIEENDILTSISSLSNITDVETNLVVEDNPLLTNLEGLESLNSIGGTLFLDESPSLENIDALSNLTSIGNGITIWRAPSLQNVLGLSSVTDFNGRIAIGRSTTLVDLEGLQNIPAESITELYFFRNDNLSICGYPNICQYLSDDLGPATFELNSFGCNNENEIIDHCNGITSIQDLENNYEFSISPNPLSSHATLASSIPLQNAELYYTDIYGKVVQSNRHIYGTNHPVLSDELSSGIYILTIVQEQQMIGRIKVVLH